MEKKIKELNEQLAELLEDEEYKEKIEWIEEPLFNIFTIENEEELANLTNSIEYIDFDDAIDKMVAFYKQGKLDVWAEDVIEYEYKDKPCYLSLVMGKLIKKNNKLYALYGIKHIFDTHSKEYFNSLEKHKSISASVDLEQMLHKLPEALDKGNIFKSAKFPDKLYVYYQGYLYVIFEKRNDTEVSHLHNLFRASKRYIKKLK